MNPIAMQTPSQTPSQQKKDPTERLVTPGVFHGGLKPPSSGPDQRKKEMDAFLQTLQTMRMGMGKPPGTNEQEQIISAPDIKPIARNTSTSSFSVIEGQHGGTSLANSTSASADIAQPALVDEMFRRMMEHSPMPPGFMPQEARQPKISPEEAQAREALDKQRGTSIVAEIVALYHTFGQQVELLAGAYRPETIINSGYQERTDNPQSVKKKREAQLGATQSKSLAERVLSIFRGRQKQEAEQKASDEALVQQKIEQEKEARLAQIPDTGAKKPRGDVWGMFTEKGKRAKQAAQLLEPVKKGANIAMKFFNERFVAISAAFMRMLGHEHNPSNRVG